MKFLIIPFFTTILCFGSSNSFAIKDGKSAAKLAPKGVAAISDVMLVATNFPYVPVFSSLITSC
jgi:hypothetical protein